MDEPLLTSKEVADRFAVSVSSVSRWAREGLVPVVHTPGGTLRFRREDIDHFLQNREPAA